MTLTGFCDSGNPRRQKTVSTEFRLIICTEKDPVACKVTWEKIQDRWTGRRRIWSSCQSWNDDLFNWMVKSQSKPQKIMAYNIFTKWPSKPQNDRERNNTKARTLAGKALTGMPEQRDFRGGHSALFPSIPSKEIFAVKLFFNLHLYNFFRLIKF